MSEVESMVERLVQHHGQFDGKYLYCYLHDYKSEMLQCGISEGLQVLSFNRVATDGLPGGIHATQQQHPTWAAFEEAMKSTYSMEDTSKAMRRGFEDWVETPKKELKVLEVFTEFER
mgnify:CR=1 FL=1